MDWSRSLQKSKQCTVSCVRRTLNNWRCFLVWWISINTILFEHPVCRRHQRILPFSLVLITITHISEKRRLALDFTSCFNFLTSKVKPVVVPKNLGSRLFVCGVTLAGGAVETEPHFPFSCLAVLLTFFFYSRVFPHCRRLLHHCSCLPVWEPYRTFVCLCLNLWSTLVSISSPYCCGFTNFLCYVLSDIQLFLLYPVRFSTWIQSIIKRGFWRFIANSILMLATVFALGSSFDNVTTSTTTTLITILGLLSDAILAINNGKTFFCSYFFQQDWFITMKLIDCGFYCIVLDHPFVVMQFDALRIEDSCF